MRRINNALPVIMTLVITFLFSLSVVAGGVVFEFGAKEQIMVFAEPSADANIALPETPVEQQEDESAKADLEKTPSKEETSSSADTAAEVMGKGEAKGKIEELFMSPYSAKYSYNNVYMKNTSGIEIDLKTELAAKLKFKIKRSSEPQVLIMHTHATECYMNELRDYYTSTDATRSTDNNENVTHIGDIIAKKIKAAGFGVVQDKTHHDHPAYSGSYDRSKTTVLEYLKKYPSIKIVIDLHRDSISKGEADKIRPVAEIDGRQAAQVMLCMGSQSGAVTGHKNWRENFRLALKLQQTMEVMYPGLARPMVLASKLYNQHLTTGSLLIEMGADTNTLSQAEYSAELVGNALVGLLNTLC